MPHGADLLDHDCWMRLHPTIMIKETFRQLQGGNRPRQMNVGSQSTKSSNYHIGVNIGQTTAK